MKEAMARTGIEQAIIFEDLVDIGFDQGIAKGREEGREEGRIEGLRAGVYALIEALGLEVDAKRRSDIESFDYAQLTALLDRLKRLRAFE